MNIYALIDPIDNKIRYIGKTKETLERRLSKHISNIKYEISTHKTNWIKKLIKNKIKPKIELIEICDDNNWIEREKFYIEKYKGQLTNTTSGGEGIDSQIVRCRMIKIWKNKKYKKLHSGKYHHMKLTENKVKVTGKNNGMYGKHHTQKTKEKISKSMMGHKQSKYQKRKVSECNKFPKSQNHKINISLSKCKLKDKYDIIKYKMDIDGYTYKQVADLFDTTIPVIWRLYNKKNKFQQTTNP